MGRHPVIDRRAVRRALDRYGSANAAAKALGLPANTVLCIKRELDGRCTRCNGELQPGEERQCASCAAYARERARIFRETRVAAGKCLRCGKPVGPISRNHCAEHSAQRATEQRALKARWKVERPEEYATIVARQNKRTAYGETAVVVWDKSQGDCQVCGAKWRKRHSHIHHIDGDKQNNSEDNLICVCSSCHKLLHELQWHPNLAAFLPWFRATYPEVKIP